MPVSLRLPVEIAERVAKRAAASDTTAHAFMLQAIREKLDADEAQAAFQAEAQRRLAGMRKSGKAIPAEEVFAYLRARVTSKGEKVKRPKARKPA